MNHSLRATYWHLSLSLSLSLLLSINTTMVGHPQSVCSAPNLPPPRRGIPHDVELLKSTPVCPASGKIIAADAPSTNQAKNKDSAKEELCTSTWQLPARELGRALSAKTRRADVEPFNLADTDVIANYDIELDALLEELPDGRPSSLDEAVKIFKPPPVPIGKFERDHYNFIAEYLTSCVETCEKVLDKDKHNPSDISQIDQVG